MTEIQQLLKQYQDFYDGKPWYGRGFRDVVDEITPAEALNVAANGRSIAQLLLHMIKWRKALTIRLEGDESFNALDEDPDNWADVHALTESDWIAAKEEFANLQEVLLSELAKRDDVWLDIQFLPDQERFTYRYLTIGVVQHDIHHLGQIALLKQLQRA